MLRDFARVMTAGTTEVSVGTLALEGGTPVRSRPFPTWPCHDVAERDGLLRALEGGAWGRMAVERGECTAFEAEFAGLHRAPAALAVSNGTHALQLALEMVGVGHGDEVIVPAFMPMPTSNAVRQRGAVPVPADVDPVTYCLDPRRLDAVRTARTRAVIPVHWGGHVADIDAIAAWAQRAGVVVIQDAAHAHGATWRDRGLGEFGTLVTFSFQMSKLMTAGEGGAVLLPTAEMWDEAYARHRLGARLGGLPMSASSNYRLSEFAAAVLRAQLARLPGQNERRGQRWAELVDLLGQVPGVMPQGRDPRCTLYPRYMPAVTVDLDRYPGLTMGRLVAAMRAEGVPTRPVPPPVYSFAAFWDGPSATLPSREELAAACPVSERLGARGLYWPHELLLGEPGDVRDIAGALDKVLRAGVSLTGSPNRG